MRRPSNSLTMIELRANRNGDRNVIHEMYNGSASCDHIRLVTGAVEETSYQD